MRPGTGSSSGDWAPGEFWNGEEPKITWKKKRFILPRMCYVTLKWTGFFPLMYVGTKHYPLSNDTTTWLVTPEVYIFRVLKGEKVI